jgi:hypothetical protein
MYMSCHQTRGQNLYKGCANKSFGNVAELKYLGMMEINQNWNHKEIKSKVIQGMLTTCSSETFGFPSAI